MRVLLLLMGLSMLSACGGGSDNQTTMVDSPIAPPPASPAQPAPEDDLTYRILFIGNSHTAAHQMPQMVEALINRHLPDQKGRAERVPHYRFLADHAVAQQTLAQLNSAQWSHVVLQAQKYSQSFSREYPIDGALSLIDKSQQLGASAIMFPEWAQRSNSAETEYIHNIHVGIAQQSDACVAPVGYAWARALELRPELELHADDGNHSSLTGSYLTALVIFETLTGEPADLLPATDVVNIDADLQRFLGQAATFAIANHAPCDY